MIGGLMRAFGGFASKIAPRISRGIGQAVTASRHIGTAVRQEQSRTRSRNSWTNSR